MTRVAYQPCTNRKAQANLIKTLTNPVSIERLSALLEAEDIQTLRRLYPDGSVYVWGVNGNSNTQSSWDNLSQGDISLFNIKGVFSFAGVVTHKVKSRAAALDLWGIRDEKDQSTWECLYFLDQVSHITVPYNLAFKGTAKKPRIPFTLMQESDSEIVLANTKLDLSFAELLDNPSLDEARAEILKQRGTDGVTETKTRKEHSFIVQHLFHNRPEDHCSICRKLYPRTYLVAAHLKKRSNCTQSERLDIENIAAPMCTFGCDSLYEKGFISVDEAGCIIPHPSRIRHESLRSYVEQFAGNTCTAFNKRTAKYFRWHRREHGYEELP
ncbi:MAG: hypothetical protein MI794_05860 [Pseudomonadales bacterium]|nr:hypothetical protein [Pseudomonadales bacterium]